MLWQRVLTALVLIPLVVWGVLYLDNRLLAAVFGLVVLLGAHEMAHLGGLGGVMSRVAFVAVVAAVLWLSWRYLPTPRVRSVQWLAVIWWLPATVALFLRRSELPRIEGVRPVVLLLGGLVLVAAWLSIVTLHAAGPHGPAMVLYLLVLIWVADSGAYFAGRALGRRRLSPFVSPGKTWAGAGGALVGAVISALLLSYSGAAGQVSLLPLLALSLLVTLISIGGDLWESRLKREAGVKDSGTLLPGHGGMLDRIDSLLAAAPVFALGASLIGVTV